MIFFFHPHYSAFQDFFPLDGSAVPWKENAGYHRDTLGVPVASERKEGTRWVGGLG